MDSPAQTVAIEMTGVDVSSMTRPADVSIEDVHWRVHPGDYWIVGGLQGTGKSDLLFTAAGLLPPLRGFLRVLGHEVSPGYEKELLATRLAVGLVFDGGRLLNELSLAENVALPLLYHLGSDTPASGARVASLLEFVGLADYTSRMPGSLNRNLQQRAGLARALALKPSVLLLDNPLSGLDPRDTFWWLDCLDKLAAGDPVNDGQAVTLVATGDDLRPWRSRATKFGALNNGRFVALGGREDILAHPEPSLRELLRR